MAGDPDSVLFDQRERGAADAGADLEDAHCRGDPDQRNQIEHGLAAARTQKTLAPHQLC